MEQNAEFIEKILSLKGMVREFGSFFATLDDKFNLIVYTNSGWSITYPFGVDAWAFLMTWFEAWDDMSKKCVENFIKGIVFPTSVRINGIDEEYMNDIVNAHEALTKRMIDSGEFEIAEPEQESESEPSSESEQEKKEDE